MQSYLNVDYETHKKFEDIPIKVFCIYTQVSSNFKINLVHNQHTSSFRLKKINVYQMQNFMFNFCPSKPEIKEKTMTK